MHIFMFVLGLALSLRLCLCLSLSRDSFNVVPKEIVKQLNSDRIHRSTKKMVVS